MEQTQTREVLKFVVTGHVDHGKSTLIGRLLYDTDSLPAGAIEKVRRISKETGKPFEYAYLLDAFEEEQKQGITIDTTSIQFHTKKRDYVIIDAPGHVEFLKNMISGAANAEAALLLVDAKEGIREQSKRHGYILSLLGIRKVYVIVNKMDLVGYSRQRFEEIKAEADDFLGKLHIFPLKYIPVAAFSGDNIAFASEKMPWYKGQTVLDAIDAFEKDKALDDRPLRFPIQDIYKFGEKQKRIIAGRIESGTLRVGDRIRIHPSEKETTVKSIEHWAPRDETGTVTSGMSVGVTVADEFFNDRGFVITHVQDRPCIGDSFEANIFWMGKKPLQKGGQYKLKLSTQEVPCEITAVRHVVDAGTLTAVENAETVEINGVAEVTVKTKARVVFDLFKNNHVMGRFVLVDGYDVCGGGIVSGEAAQTLTGSVFRDGPLSMEVHLFDEYYFSPALHSVSRRAGHANVYGPDDIIPVERKTYGYPADFDLVSVRQGLVAAVRGARFEKLVPLAEYAYGGGKLIDEGGCAVNVASEDEWRQFLHEVGPQSDGDSLNRWLDFGRFRTIRLEAG